MYSFGHLCKNISLYSFDHFSKNISQYFFVHLCKNIFLYSFDLLCKFFKAVAMSVLEKPRWELYKDATCCFKQILEASPSKTAAVGPFTAYLTNHPSKTSKTRSKDKLISDVLLWTPTHGHTRIGQPVKTYIYLLCEYLVPSR